MKLELTINGVEDRIEIRSPAPDCRFLLSEGPETSAQVEIPEPAVYSIQMGGRSYEASVTETPSGLVVVVDGYRFEIEARDPRRFTRKAAGRGTDGVQTIAAPMPGKVVRVLIAAGEAVEAGQGLVVVEAMKMQNEMKAPRAGKVLSLAAREGATVAAGEVLATIG
jgi:biotin carboxyl carrier protein